MRSTRPNQSQRSAIHSGDSALTSTKQTARNSEYVLETHGIQPTQHEVGDEELARADEDIYKKVMYEGEKLRVESILQG